MRATSACKPVWLGLVKDREAEIDILAWIDAGGPGIAELPDVLSLYLIQAPRPSRRTP